MANGYGIDLASIFNAAEQYKARKIANEQSMFQFAQQQRLADILPQARAAAQRGDFSMLAQIAPDEAMKMQQAMVQNQRTMQQARKTQLESQGMQVEQNTEKEIRTAQAIKQSAMRVIQGQSRGGGDLAFDLERNRLSNLMKQGVINEFPLDSIAKDPESLNLAIRQADATLSTLQGDKGGLNTSDLQNFAAAKGFRNVNDLTLAIQSNPALGKEFQRFRLDSRKAGATSVNVGQNNVEATGAVQGELQRGLIRADSVKNLVTDLGRIEEEAGGFENLLGYAADFEGLTLNALDKIFPGSLTQQQRDRLGVLSDFAGIVDEFRSEEFRRLLGAAQTETEVKNLVNAVLSRDMGSIQFTSAYNRLKRTTERAIRLSEQVLSQGFDVGTKKYNSAMTKAMKEEEAQAKAEFITQNKGNLSKAQLVAEMEKQGLISASEARRSRNMLRNRGEL